MGGVEWLTGALGGIGSLLGKVSSYVDMLLSFLACDALQCKKYDDWLQGEKGFKKPPTSWLNILNAQEKKNKPVEVSASNKSEFDTLSDGQINRILETPVGESSPEGLTVDADTKSQLEAYVGQQSGEKKKRWRLNNMFAKLNELALEDYPPNYGGKFSLLSILGNNELAFFDCNEKTQNPKTQDDLGRGVPPGFTWRDCIPPKVEVRGDGTKTAALLPIVSSVDGSILTLEILDKGFGYTAPPSITIIDKTRHGGGAQAEAILDDNGSIVSVFMMANGGGYCAATYVVPPKYPVTEGPGITTETDEDNIDPYITFTTPADNAVGVNTSASLSITFNEPIVVGTGEIVITESLNNIIHERINVKAKNITFLADRIIKVEPTRNLKSNTEYFVSMS